MIIRRNSFSGLAIASIVAVSLIGCAPDVPNTDTPIQSGQDAGEKNEPATKSTTDSDASSGTEETSVPAGARAASQDFPFPVPEGWDELDPFTEEKIGKDLAMTASYQYPGEATAAASLYLGLLTDGGFDAQDDIVGAMTNKASVGVIGMINGVSYKGRIDFDSFADGTQRAVINLFRR